MTSDLDQRAPHVLESHGYCPTCANESTFSADSALLRESFRCEICGSIPRERALMLTVDTSFPN